MNDDVAVTVYESDGATVSTLFKAVADQSVPNGYKIVTIAVADGGIVSWSFDFEGGTTSYDLVISADDGTHAVTETVTGLPTAGSLVHTMPSLMSVTKRLKLYFLVPVLIAENTTAETDTGLRFVVTDDDSTITLNHITVFDVQNDIESQLFKAVADRCAQWL